MTSKTEIGKTGEKEAVAHLKAKGYTILFTNYRNSRREIDIIAKYEETIIFVEVKKRKNATYGSPESFVSLAQKKRICKAAEHFMRMENWFGEIRFDIISIENKEIVHFEDAF